MCPQGVVTWVPDANISLFLIPYSQPFDSVVFIVLSHSQEVSLHVALSTILPTMMRERLD